MKWPILLILLLLQGCGIGQVYELQDISTTEGVYIDVLSIEDNPVDAAHPDMKWQAKFRFYENTKYKHIIQIITFSNGQTLVEAFNSAGGWPTRYDYDRHWSASYQVRKMVTYPGNIEGADWSSNNFCMLPENEQGVPTTMGIQFNAKYRAKHKLQGKIVAADQSLAVVWSIEASTSGTRVYIPSESLVQPSK